MRASNVFMLEFLMVKNQNLEVDKFFYADKMDTRNYFNIHWYCSQGSKKKAPSGSLGEVDFLAGQVAVN